MDRAEIISEIKKLDLPPGSYVIISGASLAMRGIRDTQDIDMLILPKVIEVFAKKGFKEKIEKDGTVFLLKDKFEVSSKLKTSGYHINTGKIIKNAEIINGIPCSKLSYEISFKTAWAREKDFNDIKLIEDYLKKMRKIEKKTVPDLFQKVLDGDKTFDLRLNRFEVKEGDTLVLREWDPKIKDYTGRVLEKEITFVLKTKELDFWPKEEVDKHGFIVMGFK